jgi:hypothetical protein
MFMNVFKCLVIRDFQAVVYYKTDAWMCVMYLFALPVIYTPQVVVSRIIAFKLMGNSFHFNVFSLNE